MVWNIDGVFTSAWGKQIDSWLDELEGDTPQYKTGKWRIAFDRTELFSRLEEDHLSSERITNAAEVMDRVMSISFVAALSAAERAAFGGRVANWLATHPESRGQETLRVPFDTKIYWCFRK
jgi:hypothetical protein